MTRDSTGSGQLPLVRDRTGFLNVAISVNQKPYTAVIDTGAAFSALSESTAEKLGLTPIPGKVRIGSATRNGIEARIAVADRLDLGTVVLRHVVFIVLPDNTFSLLGGIYKLEAVIGLPVMQSLERFAVVRRGGKEWLQYGDGAPSAEGGTRIVLAGAKSYVLTEPNGRKPPLRLVIDTGADRSWLVWQALAEHPELASGTLKVHDAGVLSGAGGAAQDSDALMIPSLNLDFGYASVPVKDIKIYSRSEKVRQGVLGQDVLRSGFVVDYVNMKFRLDP